MTVIEFNLSRAQLMDSPGNPEAVRADYRRRAEQLRQLLDRIDALPHDYEPHDVRTLANHARDLWESLACAAARGYALNEINAYLQAQQLDARRASRPHQPNPVRYSSASRLPMAGVA